MSFWATVLAMALALIIYDVTTAIIKSAINVMEERNEKKRQIGFGSEEVKEKTRKGVTMRKIGFGEQD